MQLEEEIKKLRQSLAANKPHHFDMAKNDETVPKDQYDQMIKNAEETVKKVGAAAQAWRDDREEMAKKYEAAKGENVDLVAEMQKLREEIAQGGVAPVH